MPVEGREQRGLAVQRRLQLARLGAAQPVQVLHAVGDGRAARSRAASRPAPASPATIELAAAPMRDAVRLAVRVEQAPPGDAEARLERAGRVVDAGVDDLAVARADAGADAAVGLEHDRLAAARAPARARPRGRRRRRRRRRHRRGPWRRVRFPRRPASTQSR